MLALGRREGHAPPLLLGPRGRTVDDDVATERADRIVGATERAKSLGRRAVDDEEGSEVGEAARVARQSRRVGRVARRLGDDGEDGRVLLEPQWACRACECVPRLCALASGAIEVLSEPRGRAADDRGMQFAQLPSPVVRGGRRPARRLDDHTLFLCIIGGHGRRHAEGIHAGGAELEHRIIIKQRGLDCRQGWKLPLRDGLAHGDHAAV
mmetsp:Transcript_27205/g.58597  ORF Transcript_27205/g.58597 Transcript_27205/m.58597 type:complete len:210 (-) Transcript_27205:140-769(-)